MQSTESLPDIVVALEDLAILSDLIRNAFDGGSYVAASRLANELHRACIVRASEVPADCLRLNVPGRYLEERSGAVRQVTLVAGESRSSFGMVSVLSCVGTALLGLSEGQRMGWLDRRGKPRVVRLLEVARGDAG